VADIGAGLTGISRTLQHLFDRLSRAPVRWMQSDGTHAQTRLALVRPMRTAVPLRSEDSDRTALPLRGVYMALIRSWSPRNPNPSSAP